MNMFNLLQGVRDFLFPVLMFGAMALGALTGSAKAVVYYNDVAASAVLLGQEAPDGGPTVEEALKASANADVVKGATNKGGESGNNYDLTLTDNPPWQKDKDGDFVSVEVRYMGSPQKTCSVYAKKTGDTYLTKCTN